MFYCAVSMYGNLSIQANLLQTNQGEVQISFRASKNSLRSCEVTEDPTEDPDGFRFTFYGTGNWSLSDVRGVRRQRVETFVGKRQHRCRVILTIDE
jgi:hypothetical protein